MTTSPTANAGNSARISGVDMAREALRKAREDAKQRPYEPTRNRAGTVKRAKTDPLLAGDVFQQLVSGSANWAAHLGESNIIDQWPTIAPELNGLVAAERWDAERRVLHLRPVSPAYATQLRLVGAQLVARINAKAKGAQVASIRVLPPGAVSPHDSSPAAPTARADAPVLENLPQVPKPAGYEAARQIAADARLNKVTDEALRDQHFGRHRGWLREPEDAFTEAIIEPPVKLRETSADIHLRALAAARAMKAGKPIPGMQRLADTA